jgi:hypothetical protein
MGGLFELALVWASAGLGEQGPFRRRVALAATAAYVFILTATVVTLFVGAFFFGPWPRLTDLGGPVLRLAALASAFVFVLHLASAAVARTLDAVRSKRRPG